VPEEAPTRATKQYQNKPRNENDEWRRALVVLIFLLFSFLCLFCSSQSALYFVDREKITGDMRSQQQADYGDTDSIILAPLDKEKLLTAVAKDSLALSTPEALEAGGVVIVPLPQTTAVAALPTIVPPIPTLTPTPTSTPSPTPTLEPTSSPEATEPPPTATEPPTSTAVLITVSPTLVTPSATPVTPSATPVTPSATPVTPSATPVTPSATPVTPSATPVTPSATPVTPSPTPTSTATSMPTPTATPTNRPPVAVNDPFPVTNEDVATTTNVLANDSDPDGDPLTIISVTTPASGTTAIISNRIVYTPTLNYFGTDIFTYTISDGALTDTARVTVTVNGINDAPVATNATASTAEDSPENITIIPDFASDPEGPLTILSVGTPTLGTVTYNTSVITYTPSSDLNGTDIFTYTVTDGMLTDTAAVTVTIFAINDPPVAVNDVYTTSVSGSPLSEAAPGVLGNDSDVDGDTLTATLVTPPTTGILTFNGDGSFIYTATVTGTDSFTYQAGDGAASSVATVTIDVTP
jgi:hypothetical protein